MFFVWFFIGKRAQTPAAPRRGGGLGPLGCKKPHKSRSRDPSRPAPEALVLVHRRGGNIDGPGRGWTLAGNLKLFKDPEIDHFGDLGGSGCPGNHSKWRRAKPPTGWNGFQGPRGRPDPQNGQFPGPYKILRIFWPAKVHLGFLYMILLTDRKSPRNGLRIGLRG